MYSLKVKQEGLALEKGYSVAITIGVQTITTRVCESEEVAEWLKGCVAVALDNLMTVQGEWIDCKDRLPEEGVPALTFPYSMMPVRHTKKDEEGNLRWFFDALPVTHWRPLPLGPKQEDHGEQQD